MHEGGFQVERLPGGALQFRTPNGWVIPEAPALPDVFGELTPDAQVDARTLTPNWDGTRLDLDLVIRALHPRARGH